MAFDREKLRAKAKANDQKRAMEMAADFIKVKSTPYVPPKKITPLMARLSGGGTKATTYPNIGRPLRTKRTNFAPINTNDRGIITNPTFFERARKTALGAVKNYGGTMANTYDVLLRGIDAITPGDAYEINDMAKQKAINIIEGQLNDSNLPSWRRWILEKRLEAAKKSITPREVDKKANELIESSTKDIKYAKKGLPKAGELAVDVGVGGLQLLGDIGAGLATGGTALAPMAIRSFGGSAYEAEQGGGTLGQQMAYGGLSAATSVLVERISNVGNALTKAYGKGALDNTLQTATTRAINKLVQNGVVSDNIATALTAAAGEGLEEVIESTLSPLYQRITYDPDAAWNAEDIIYDGLVGAIIGGLAGGANVFQTIAQNTADTRSGKKLKNQWGADYDAAVQELIATGREFSKDTAANELASKMQGRLDAGKQIPSSQVASLLRSNILAQQQIERAASTFGKAGSNAFTKMYNDGTDTANYLGDFARVYKAAKDGKGVDSVDTTALNTAQKKAAYLAGQQDAKYNRNTNYMETEKMNNGRTESIDDGSRRLESLDTGEQGRGLAEGAGRDTQWNVQTERSKSRLAAAEAQGLRQVSSAELGLSSGTDTATVRVLPANFDDEVLAIHKQAESDGVKVVCVAGDFEVKTAGGVRLANGVHVGDTIYVSMTDSRYTGTQIYKHEQTHDIIARERAENNGESSAFERIRREILAHDDGELCEMIAAYEKRYHCVDDVIDEDYILEEIICDSNAGIDIFAGSDTIEGATKYSETVKETFRESTSKNKKTTTSEMGGGLKLSINSSFADEIEAWDGKSKRAFRVGSTSNALKSIGIQDRNIVLYSDKLGRILNKHRAMTTDVVKQIPDILEHPIIVLKSKNFNTRIAIFGEVRDSNGTPVTAILELQPTDKGGRLIDLNIIASAYGKDSGLANFIESSDILYIDKNKNRTNAWMQSVGLQLPSDATMYGSIGRVTYIDGKVNIEGISYNQLMQDSKNNYSMRYSLKENDGNKQPVEESGDIESKAFIEWFGDWHNVNADHSMVVDEDGKPLVVYHGTGTTIEAFKPEFTGKGNDQYGSGFYFTTDKETAQGYTTRTLNEQTKPGGSDNPNVIPVFLNIRSPIVVEESTTPNLYDFEVSPVKATKIISMSSGIMDAENSILGDFFEEYWETGPKKSMIQRLGSMYEWTLGTLESDLFRDNPTEFREAVNKVLGYDGIQVNFAGGSRHYIAWFPNQIKHATENVGTFSNDDARIRHSLKSETDLEKQVKKLAEQNERLRNQLKVSTDIKTDRKGIEHLARSLKKTYSSETDTNALVKGMTELYYYIANSRGEDISWDKVKGRAVEIAADVVNNANVLNDDMYQAYSDLRSRLRGTTIWISRYDANDIADFNDFRKSQFGRFNVSYEKGLPIDSLYHELSEIWPEWFNEKEVSAPSDQLLQIADVLDGLQPVYENPFSYNMRCATEMVANDIIESFYDVPQQAPTYADRMTSKVEAAKAKGKQDVEALREIKNEKISGMISKEEHHRQIDTLREQKNERIANIRERQRNNTEWLLLREKAKRERKVWALKDHYAEIRKNAQARKADSASRTRLLNIAKRLKNKKLPAVQRGLLNQYIGELDTMAKSITGQTLEKLTDLRKWYEKQRDNNPDFISDPRIEKQLERLSQHQISDLSLEEVEALTEVLLNIENEIRTHRNLIDEQDRRDVFHMGVQVIEDIEKTKGSKGKGVKNALDTYIITETLSPMRQVRRMTGYVDNDPLYVLTNSLTNGQRKSFDYQMRASKKFNKFTEDKKFMDYLTGKGAEGIEITGISGKEGPVTVMISPAMRVSLYLHSLNDQNLKHIAGGGITVPDWELYKAGKLSEAYSRGKTIKLTPSEVRKITSRMSEKERAFARTVHAYFNGQSRNEINAVSEKLKGYSLAQVDDYFPINTDSSFTRKEFDTIKFDGTIENQGWTKERINSASPIYLRDVNDVALRAVKQHGDYVGMAIPIRNFNKVWGVTKSSFNEDGSRNSFESSVQAAVRGKWGDAGYNYVEKMISDLSPTKKQADVWGKLLSKVRSNYAKAVLTLNLSVAMKQAASYPTAAAVLGWRPINRAMADLGKVDLKLIEKYTPIQWYRSQGFTTQELGDLAAKDKSLPAVLNWVQHIDLMTTRKLWKASEYYVRYNNKKLRIGSEEYYHAVADIYNRVIEETQPNYTTMQRPQLLRSDNQLMQSLAMFKTQPFQNFNILYDATGNLVAKRAQFLADGRAEAATAYKVAKTAFGRAVTSQVAQLAVFAAMTLAWNALRGKWDKYKDDEEDPTLETILRGLGKDMVGGAFGTIPWGTDVYELGASVFLGDTYYGLDAVVPSAISDALTAIKNFSSGLSDVWSDVTAEDTKIDWKKQAHSLDDMIDAVSKVLGIPYENVTNLYAIVYEKTASALLGKTLGNYYTMQATKDMSKTYNQQKAYDLLYRAYSSGGKDYESLYNAMIDDGFEVDKIRNAIESRKKDEQGVKSVTDLDSRYLTPQEQKDYDTRSQELERNALWSKAPKTQQDFAYDILYGLATGSDSSDVKSVREKATEGAAYGVSETEMILLRVALEMYDENKNGHYNKTETQSAIDAISGLSQEERAYMFGITNSSKYNPYA